MRGGTLLVCVLAACRFHFDPLGGDAGTPGVDSGGASEVICNASSFTAIHGGANLDDVMATSVAQNLATMCGGTATVRSVSQDDPGILDPTTDRPLLAMSDLGVVGGGDSFHRVMRYLQVNDTPIVYELTASRYQLVERATNVVLFDQMRSALDSSHDVAIIELTYEPIGGATILTLAGNSLVGSQAAGYWFTSSLIPALATARRWYVLEWFDGNADLTPNAGDTFTIVAMSS